MLTEEEQRAASEFLDDFVEAMKADAAAKKINFPEESKFRKVVTDTYVKLYGPSYLHFLIVGRGPGKMPPVDSIEAAIKKHRYERGRDKRTGRYISDRSLAWSIANGISKRGTLIFQKKKPGLDFIGSMEKGMDRLLKIVARNEAAAIMTNLVKAIA